MAVERRTRRDALANREQILDAAERVYTEQGIRAPLLAIIKAAGVGNGTFYRHFPDADALTLALYDRIEQRIDAIAKRCEATDGGWEALLGYIDGITESLLAHPFSADIMRRAGELLPGEDRGAKYREPMRRYVAQAKAEGRVRDDLAPTDVAAVPFMVAYWSMRFPDPLRARYQPRVRALVLAGLTNRDDDPLPGPAVDADEFRDVTHGVAE